MLQTGDFATASWSLGGFLLGGGPAFALGAMISGDVLLPAGAGIYGFTAEAVRCDSDGTGLRFVDGSMPLVGALDRVLASRLLGGRP